MAYEEWRVLGANSAPPGNPSLGAFFGTPAGRPGPAGRPPKAGGGLGMTNLPRTAPISFVTALVFGRHSHHLSGELFMHTFPNLRLLSYHHV